MKRIQDENELWNMEPGFIILGKKICSATFKAVSLLPVNIRASFVDGDFFRTICSCNVFACGGL